MQNSWCFHLSLNVASLPRAVEFYRVLFGMEPAKCHDDYAKFEVFDPPVVFSLVPHAVGANGMRSQIGLQLATQDQLHQIRSRLLAKSIAVKSSECGKHTYSIVDLDGNRWQLSVGDHLPDGAPPAPATLDTPVAQPGQPIVWEHYVTANLPERIPHGDATVDEVRLTGSFNGDHHDDARRRLVADAFRVLKPLGKVVVHALAADKPFPRSAPRLPGLAAMVSHVPLHRDILAVLTRGGFIGVQLTKFDAKPWFEHDGVGMREVKAIAWKPLAALESGSPHVIYRGPFRQIRDDLGNLYPRGQRVAIAFETWTMLRQSPSAGQFVFVEPDQTAATCQVMPTPTKVETNSQNARAQS